MSGLPALAEILHQSQCSLVVSNNGEIHTFNQRGIADLYHLLTHNPTLLEGAEIADKVVGKGAAALMIIGKVKSVYADVVSEPAKHLFEEHSVGISYGVLTPNIINRKGDGICPVEKLCLSAHSPIECLPLINHFLSTMLK